MRMREEGEALGLEGGSIIVEEEGVGEGPGGKDETLGEETMTSGPDIPKPLQSPTPLSDSEANTPEGTDVLPSQNGSPKAKSTKLNNDLSQGQAAMPLSKTERRARRRNHRAEETGIEHIGSEQQDTDNSWTPQAPGVSKRDKRRAKQVKKAESAESQEVCISGCLT